MAKIFLVRNGSFDRGSEILTSEDERLAGRLGEDIARFIKDGKRAVFSSPANRALQTASKIGACLKSAPIEFNALYEDGTDPIPIANVIERQTVGNGNDVILVTQLPQIRMLADYFSAEYGLSGEERIPDNVGACQAVLIDALNEYGRLFSV